jgi:adenine deaminase
MEITLCGQIVDVIQGRIFPGKVRVRSGIIEEITEQKSAGAEFILPGLVDAHIHIESSLLVPTRFASLALRHGSIASVSDPHEIANVLGKEGVYYMLEEAKGSPFKFFFGAPSCVPASAFETAGAILGPQEVKELLENPEILYLAEVMNFPGVLRGDADLISKIETARNLNLPIDGHAPGLRGDDLRRYAQAGPSTDHECTLLEEGLERIRHGIKVSIREGSAAKNFTALIDLIDQHPDFIMLCTDDMHPDDLLVGHINRLIAKAIQAGKNPINVIRSATLNPIKHYNLPLGLLRKGDRADLIVVDSLLEMNVLKTFVGGVLVAENGKTRFQLPPTKLVNKFKRKPLLTSEIAVRATNNRVRAVGIVPGELITEERILTALQEGAEIASNPTVDLLKLVVVNRYQVSSQPAVAFVHGLGLKRGAIASSVAHDSHNIVAAGVSDSDIIKAINLIIKHKGGLSLVLDEEQNILPLPIAGLMSAESGEEVAKKYTKISQRAKSLGSTLPSPFMSLSFLALSVIPELKLTDQGLFDVKRFVFTDLNP